MSVRDTLAGVSLPSLGWGRWVGSLGLGRVLIGVVLGILIGSCGAARTAAYYQHLITLPHPAQVSPR